MHRGTALIAAIALAALAVAAGMPQHAGAASVTTLTLSGPQWGTSPVYVSWYTEFTLTADPVSEIWYQWEGYDMMRYTGPFVAEGLLGASSSAPALLVELDDGLHTLYYNATGEAVRSAQFIVDNTGATTTLFIEGEHYVGAADYVTLATEFVASSEDAGCGAANIYYRVDADPYSLYTVPFKLTAPGQHTITVYGTDNLQNEGQETSKTVFMDLEAPLVEIELGTSAAYSGDSIWISSAGTVALDISDISGVSVASYRLNSGAWSTYTAPFTIPTSGECVIDARATDNLGRTSEIVSATVNVDGTAPTVTITGHSSEIVNLRKGGDIEFEVADVGIGIGQAHYSLDNGTTWFDYTVPVIFTEDTVVTYYATDSVGNASPQRVAYVTITEGGLTTTQYLGIGLIAGGIIVGLLSFWLTRKAPGASKDRGEAGKPAKKDKKIRRR